MPTKREIMTALGIPPNTKTRQAINRAIRLCCPGGAELLWQLEQADNARVSEPQRSEHLAAKVAKLRLRRDAMEADLRSGRQPLLPLPQHHAEA